MDLITNGIFAVAGFVCGVLVLRNNYKHLRAVEDLFKNLNIDPKVSAEQIIQRIRDRLGL